MDRPDWESQTVGAPPWPRPEGPATGEDEHKLDVARVARGIAHRKRLILLVAVVIFALLGTAVVLATANSYTAEARVLIRPAREVLQGTPLASAALPDYDEDTLEETVTLRPVLEAATKSLGDVSPEDLSEAIFVDMVPRGRVVVIGTRSNNSEDSARMANATVAAFLEYQGQRFQEQVDQTEELLETRANEARSRLKEAQEALGKFAEAKGLFDPDTEISALLQQTGEVQVQMTTLRTTFETTQARLEFIRQKLAKERATVTTQTIAAPGQGRILELEVRLSALLSRYTSEHPDVQTVQAELDAFKAQARKQGARQVQSSTEEPNPIYSTLYLQAVQSEIEVRALEAQLASLKRTKDELEERARKLPVLRAELAQLTVARRAAEATLDDTLVKLTKVQELRESPTPLFETIEDAQPPVSPERGRTALGLFFAAVMGLLIGFATAVVGELRDHRVREPSEIESLGLSVLGAVPPKGKNPTKHDEALRQVAFALRRLTSDETGRCLLVTSTLADERKTDVCRGLAMAVTDWLRPVLRIDANLRAETGEAGLLNAYLRGTSERANVAREAPGLGVLTSADEGGAAPTLLSSGRMGELLDSVRDAFRLSLLDGPAVLPSIDAEVLAEQVDGIVFIVRAWHTPRPHVQAALSRLRATGTPIIGAVLTDAPSTHIPGRAA